MLAGAEGEASENGAGVGISEIEIETSGNER